MDNEVLLKTIDNLPPLSTTVVKLRDYIDSAGADVNMQEVVKIIQQDPLLTAELLRLANSPFYGFSREISTIQQVVSLLGINNVKNVAIANSIKSTFKVDVSPYGLNTQEFLGNCIKETNFISDWLSEEDKKLSQMLVPCSMLLRLGIILFSNSLRVLGKDKEFLTTIKENHYYNIGMIEEEFCGTDSLSFLGFLLNHWKFDEALIESISYINSPHAAHDSAKKGSYALAIVNCLFEPHQGGSVFNTHKALDLIQEANEQGVKFAQSNFLDKLPPAMVANLNKPLDD